MLSCPYLDKYAFPNLTPVVIKLTTNEGGTETLQTPTIKGLRDYRIAGDEIRSQHNKMRS